MKTPPERGLVFQRMTWSLCQVRVLGLSDWISTVGVSPQPE